MVTDQPVAVIHARGLELKPARLDCVPESCSVDGVALSNFKVVLSCNIERELAIEVKSQLRPETELIGLDRADEVTVGVECAGSRFVMRLQKFDNLGMEGRGHLRIACTSVDMSIAAGGLLICL